MTLSSFELKMTNERLIARDQERLDDLLRQNKKVIESRLGLNDRSTTTQAKDPQPIRSRTNWQQTRADFENKKKKEYWDSHIVQMEKEVMNDAKVKIIPDTGGLITQVEHGLNEVTHGLDEFHQVVGSDLHNEVSS